MITTRKKKIYKVGNVREDISPLHILKGKVKRMIPLYIEKYLWVENNYRPKVEIRLGYSEKYIYLYYKVFEKEIVATYTEINNPVYKNSCVEFFINLFPSTTDEYFNFEINAIGTPYVAFGDKSKRKTLTEKDILKIPILSSLHKPFVGTINNDFWEITFAIPIGLLEFYYRKKFNKSKATANFYKCGDDTRYKHYGVWSEILTEKPNFHLPEYFGELVFV